MMFQSKFCKKNILLTPSWFNEQFTEWKNLYSLFLDAILDCAAIFEYLLQVRLANHCAIGAPTLKCYQF
jgi:hypothetical protein